MGYWTNTMERFKIRNRAKTHPWCQLLAKTLALVEPATLAELEADGELEAFLSVKVDECEKSIRAMVAQGMDPQAAKECAFDSMLPRAPDQVEDWELDGAMQEEADAFADWIKNAPSKSHMED